MLEGKIIAVPESRQLDIMANLLENRGGRVLRAPLVAIRDAPDPEPVLRWLRDFIEVPPDLLILLTGEGLRRLRGLAARSGLEEGFIEALAATRTLCRGPKPGRALSEAGLKGGIPARVPTTEGVIETLEDMPLENCRVGVQLYGSDPNRKLVDYLESRGARVDCVAPYVYADKSEQQQVAALIREMAAGRVDAIAFTSQPQVKRLLQVAREEGLERELDQGMARTAVAAVGPLVRERLLEAGWQVPIMPERAFFMKPLATAIVKHFDNPS